MFTFKVFALFNILVFVRGATYSQTDSHTGTGFLKSFTVESEADPTHGRVNYVNAATAASLNLTYASGDTFILRADSTTVLSASGPGRNSVRIQSNKQFNNSVMIFNIRHMPEGCGTWPAVWTVGPDWPNGGEIDILEGVNNQGPNQVTLHTGSGCTMPSSRSELGTPAQNNCDANVNSNSGCGVKVSDARSYGPTFNSDGGGWYAVERTSDFIKVWFWSRQATGIPTDAMNGATSVDTDNWGTPQAYFPSTSCPISSMFAPQNIVINLTFCGDWAGASSIYAASGCPSTCVDYVNNNPSAFTNAYFDFAWLKIYQ
ncbi:glycoside hydrolase family 16 protein [Hypholoma sublateritium FD-334 SS-4]|uniref:Glycoside hydrolase family 16 protein n=1 Tax=Hypholoma sublateritium (strain FD-334 SS-4) TaxID=945553 RepID=A0A0D2Q1L8_HYPSF|nr:glycoside hydrolase family 16 protein [Hypholoma sublateritium FD-334 SS-4]